METYFKLLDFIQFGLLPRIPWLQRIIENIEQCLNIPQRYILQAFVVSIFWIMATTYLSMLSTYLIFYLYPSYQTIHAIHTNANKSELIRWLSYWSVFAFFIPFERYGDIVLNSIPFINILRLLFGYWCYSSHFDGSRLIMKRYLLPIYRWIEKNSIDQIGSQAIDRLIEFSNNQNNDKNKRKSKTIF